MNYVVRILDRNGKLGRERVMFNEVRILDNNGNLKKVIKSKILSKQYWKQFPETLKKKGVRKSTFNDYNCNKKCLDLVGF